jgi:hypothetical protein
MYHLRQLGVAHFEKVLLTESGWRHRDAQVPSRDHQGAVIPASQAADNLIAAFSGGGLWAGYTSQSWTPWMHDPDVQGVVLFAMDGAPHKWGHTNLVDLTDEGQIIGVKPGFSRLLKPD